MALVTIVGYPCSGKSRRTAQLKESFQARLADPEYSGRKLEVVIIDDESCHVPTSVYDGELPVPSLDCHLYHLTTLLL